VSLPMGSNLGEGTVQRICDVIARLHQSAPAVKSALEGKRSSVAV